MSTRDLIKKVVRGVQGPSGVVSQPVSSLKFDTTSGDPSSPSIGEVWWDQDEETFSGQLSSSASLQFGQEVQWHVRNNTGSQIDNGTVVMSTGTIGASGRITVAAMDGTDITNARYVLGLATEDIANGSDGKITTFGKIRGIDTTGQGGETWSDGDVLWISSTTAGALTNVEPTDGSIGMPIAQVIYANANGTLAIRVTPIDEHNFTGRLYNYEEKKEDISFSSGTVTVNHTTCDNILLLDSLTQNSTITFTNLMAYKPITLATVADTGGPWTLSVVANSKTISLTRNGSGTADLETFELWSDGTDIYAPDAGGVVWSLGS